mmetsp:Transcript_18142/g.61725  ORF Transcript_18142/g.61725 Transcript_18142/m.61725 type:complete len:82 (-) Transcript_18142:1785-2030(-)|eukprot:CAMPEP_0183794198 /NCGR_PEP_ID=MMETSP0803_2-20130417/3698_1 /TAXON_ID=195967 /ORGANISM="Crustomastix stigmata, Strain CCMP3273" /LENGTH=81 /DNA_ID=CAMNT_0026038597 /DNA_START=374 /DNA_END=619 /DNA_ORIENTATION=+
MAVLIMSDLQYDKEKPVYTPGGFAPYTYVSATIDEDYNLIAPWNSATNPFVRLLVGTPAQLTPKPSCWDDMVRSAKHMAHS